MEVRIGGSTPINLHRYTDVTGNWGWVLRRLVNDGLQQRDFFALPTSHGLVSIGGIRTEPREWQIVLDVWGKSYADLQAARAYLTRLFPIPYSDADLVTIEARVSSAVAWRQIRALCTAIDWDEEDERFRATATLKLFSPQPYWSYETSVTFTPQPVLSSVSCVRLELSSGVVTTYNFGSTQLRRVHFVNPSWAFAGAFNNTSVWEVYVGSQIQLSSIPAGTSIGGVRRLNNGTIIAGLFDDGAVNPVYFWTGGGWSQIGYSPAMNGGVRRIGGTSNGAEYWVSGLFTQPRKLFAVFTDSHSLVTTYEDVFSDLTINTIGEASCTDAYVEENVVLAVARRQASPFTRWVRVGSLAGKTDLLSWNSNASDNFAAAIAGYSVHDVLVAGNFSSVANQIFGLQRCVRLRNLGGVEQAGDVNWGAFLNVKRCGNRIFAYTGNGAGDNWVLAWTGGGFVPILWLNNTVQDMDGNDDVLFIVGNFTQVQRWTEVYPNIPGAAAIDFYFGSGTSGQFFGAWWTDGNGAMVVNGAQAFIPSFVFPSPQARVGTDYYRLAQAQNRQNSSVARQALMLRNVTGNTMGLRVYVEDPRL